MYLENFLVVSTICNRNKGIHILSVIEGSNKIEHRCDHCMQFLVRNLGCNLFYKVLVLE